MQCISYENGTVNIFRIAPRYAHMAEWRKLLVYQLEALRQPALEINLMPPLL